MFNTANTLQKEYGNRMARLIMSRLAVLKNAGTLSEVPTTRPERCHQLKGKRSKQYAVDLKHPYRLIFKPNHEPIPLGKDGGIDSERVTAITVVEVVDYQ